MVQITSAVVAFLRERMRFWKEGGLKKMLSFRFPKAAFLVRQPSHINTIDVWGKQREVLEKSVKS